MSTPLELHQLPGSPNSTRIRLALGYKKLPHTRHDFTPDTFPGDRSGIIALSGQPRLPVLVHGDTKIFDSAAIVRYLEANFPDAPKLFREDWATHSEIEGWELYAKTRIGPAVGKIFGQAMASEPDLNEIREANEMFHGATESIESVLSERETLLEGGVTAADLAVAPGVALGALPEELKHDTSKPIHAFFATHLALGAGRERTAAWLGRILAYDREVS